MVSVVPEERISKCADVLAELRYSGEQLECLPPVLIPRNEAEAYRVQFALHDRLSDMGGGPRVGWKIGCTTKVMQEFLNIPSPCAGGMFAAGVVQSPASYDFASLRRPGVECEIAVRLRADVPQSGAPYDRQTIAPFVASVMSAMEVVEERFVNFRDPKVDAATLIADDFFHLGAVLGPEMSLSEGLNLAALGGRTWIGGQERGAGLGADVMGHPFAALAWLANHLATYDLNLKAGDIVLTGSIVASQYPETPAKAITEIAQLGRVISDFM